MIKGNVVLKCPQTGKEVRLYQDCMKDADPQRTCSFYKHFGIHAHQIMICCSYEEVKQNVSVP